MMRISRGLEGWSWDAIIGYLDVGDTRPGWRGNVNIPICMEVRRDLDGGETHILNLVGGEMGPG